MQRALTLLLISLLLLAFCSNPVWSKKHHDDDHDDDHDNDVVVTATIPDAAYNASSHNLPALRRISAPDRFVYSDPSKQHESSSWLLSDVQAKLQSTLGKKHYKRQEKRLARQVDRINHRASRMNHTDDEATQKDHSSKKMKSSGPHDHHDKRHQKDSNKYLSHFYLKHVQCRRCTRDNLAILQSASPSVASFTPMAVMKYCTAASTPSQIITAPLSDNAGYCIEANLACPINSLDLNILSPSACANDEAAVKQTCGLCVLDGYTWQTNKHAIRHHDEYDGTCIVGNSSALLSSSSSSSSHQRLITELNDCPSLTSSSSSSSSSSSHDLSLSPVHLVFIAFWIALGLCFCCALRSCYMRRAAKIAALRNNAAAVDSSSPSVAVAAINGGYPAQQAAYNDQHVDIAQPLMHPASVVAAPTVVSLPSRQSYPLAYPALHSAQPSAPPSYYQRL